MVSSKTEAEPKKAAKAVAAVVSEVPRAGGDDAKKAKKREKRKAAAEAAAAEASPDKSKKKKRADGDAADSAVGEAKPKKAKKAKAEAPSEEPPSPPDALADDAQAAKKAAKKLAKKAAALEAAASELEAAAAKQTTAEHAAKKAAKKAKKALADPEVDAAAAKKAAKRAKKAALEEGTAATPDAAAVDSGEQSARDAAKAPASDAVSDGAQAYPPRPPEKCESTILLFYAYCAKPMSATQQTQAIAFCMKEFKQHAVTGRLRVAREGYNGTLTGSFQGIRAFTKSLETLDSATFGGGKVDFKYVDNLPASQLLKGIKCWPVAEIVTYGFDSKMAPLDMRGTHLQPAEFHEALQDSSSVVIDVRNFNETLIGKFAPAGGAAVLDPKMRRSTEFPDWVKSHKDELNKASKVLMYCTGGVRCERASAFMRHSGVQNVYQLDGGVHRYLEAFEDDGGHWVGKNYTFDKRFSHGAKNAVTISQCVVCAEPWDRYQAQAKCFNCSMECLLCRPCQRRDGGPPKKHELKCPLCSQK